VANALSTSGASSTVIADALIQAVASNTISAGVAISVASAVAPETAQQVASNPVVTQQLAATGQSATVTATASTDNGAPVSVLVSLQGAATPGGGGDATAHHDPAGSLRSVRRRHRGLLRQLKIRGGINPALVLFVLGLRGAAMAPRGGDKQ
jgi:hypothetical protein